MCSGEVKTLLIITRADLTSSVAASGLRCLPVCVCCLALAYPVTFEPPLICGISASELMGPATGLAVGGERKPPGLGRRRMQHEDEWLQQSVGMNS